MPKTKKKKAYKSKKKIKTNDTEQVIDLDEEIVIGMKKKQVKEKEVHKKSNKKKKQNNRKMTEKEIKKKTSSKPKKVYSEEELEERAKRRKLIAKITKRVFLFAMLLTAIVLFMLSPLFSISDIEVEGNTKVTTQSIIHLSGLEIGQNIFRINKRQIIDGISENAYVDSAVVIRNLPSTVVVKINERKTTFMLEIGGAFAYVNNQGYILEVASEKLNVPILQGYITDVNKIVPGNRLEIEDLKKLDTVLRIMESAKSNEIVDLITKINIEEGNNYILVLEGEEKTVYLGDATSINTRMLYLKEIIERQKGVKGKIYINQDMNSKKAVFREDV